MTCNEKSRTSSAAGWFPTVSARTLAAVTVLVAGGCGESNQTSHTAARTSPSPSARVGTPSPSKGKRSTGNSQFIAGADRICRRLNTTLAHNRASQKANNGMAITLRNAALERATVAQLRVLTPPPALAADWKQMNAYRQTLADELLKLVRDTQTADTKARQVLAVSKLRVHRLLLELASRDGFKDCAQVGTAFRAPRAPSSPEHSRPGAAGPIGGL